FTAEDGSQKVTIRLLAAGPQTRTYTVTAGSTPGNYTFSGTIADVNRDSRAVGGDSTVTITAPPASTPVATRSFSATEVAPGGTVTVTVTANNYGTLGRVVETVPAGFTAADGGQTVTIRLLTAGPQTRTYTVTAGDTPGRYTFSGTIAHQDRTTATVGGASTVTITAPPAPTATRSFSPAQVAPGGTVTVTVTANNYGGLGRIVETVPAGFTAEDGSQTVTIRLLAAGPQTRTYKVTAGDTPGTYTFSGTLQDEDRNDHTVGGASSVRVRSAGGGGGGVIPPTNRAPVFGEGSSASRSVAENSAPGTAVGSPVTATDRDRDRLTYSLSGTDASRFSIDSSNGQISVAQGADLDFESKAAYAVSVRASDPSGRADSISIAIAVTNVDEDGAVTLSPERPAVGTEITATLTDPDGAVADLSWQWERSPDGAAWTAISGAESNAYTPVEADRGHSLRVTVAYADGHGGGKRAEAALPGSVPADEPVVTPAPQSVSIDVTVWRSVRTGNIYVSTRPEGERWTTHNTPIDLSNLSSSGRFYQGLPVTVSVDVGGGASANIDVTVWRSVRTGNIYVSTRPEGERWTTHNTPIDLSNLSRSGRFYQGAPLPVEVKLP
ncbi:MAG: cadherin domain-containing protein, partial [Chloroflexi bacterium]|nr:cadherin domain-containing protein [Chloroflexota bacterium]